MIRFAGIRAASIRSPASGTCCTGCEGRGQPLVRGRHLFVSGKCRVVRLGLWLRAARRVPVERFVMHTADTDRGTARGSPTARKPWHIVDVSGSSFKALGERQPRVRSSGSLPAKSQSFDDHWSGSEVVGGASPSSPGNDGWRGACKCRAARRQLHGRELGSLVVGSNPACEAPDESMAASRCGIARRSGGTEGEASAL